MIKPHKYLLLKMGEGRNLRYIFKSSSMSGGMVGDSWRMLRAESSCKIQKEKKNDIYNIHKENHCDKRKAN